MEPQEYLAHRLDSFDSGTKFNNDFRQYVPKPDHPRIKGLCDTNIFEYSKDILSRPKAKKLFQPWDDLLQQPFKGITTNGRVQEGLFELVDEGAPTVKMAQAAQRVLDSLSDSERQRCTHEVDALEWRKWSNPEIVFHETGVRLEFLDQSKINLILDLVKASLSEKGYQKVLGSMRTNHFLGELVNARPILNHYSYCFNLFGNPSEEEPWGFHLFGHHLCLNILALRGQMVLSPVFVGGEPNRIDDGPWKGTALLTTEEALGLKLMQSLSGDLQQRAQLYQRMHDPAMPPGRWHPADQRHLTGAFQDNRVVQYEGVNAMELPIEKQLLLEQVLAAYIELFPPGPRAHRLAQIHRHWKDTYFCWIGGFEDDDPFYYRIQSPVIIVEFDHHAGVFLLNPEPAKFHIHTITRTPNGGDYGKKLLQLWRKQGGN